MFLLYILNDCSSHRKKSIFIRPWIPTKEEQELRKADFDQSHDDPVIAEHLLMDVIFVIETTLYLMQSGRLTIAMVLIKPQLAVIPLLGPLQTGCLSKVWFGRRIIAGRLQDQDALSFQ